MKSSCDSVRRAMLSSLSRPAVGDAFDSHDQGVDGRCVVAVMMLAGEIDDVFLRYGVESHALLSLSVDVLDSLEQDIDRLCWHDVSCGQALGGD